MRGRRFGSAVRQPRAGDGDPRTAETVVLARAVRKVGELPTPPVLARRAVAESA